MTVVNCLTDAPLAMRWKDIHEKQAFVMRWEHIHENPCSIKIILEPLTKAMFYSSL